MIYSDYQAQNVSEKIILATIRAKKRLIAWSLHSGSIYKLESFDFPVIESIKDSGVMLTETSSVASITPGSFFNDKTNKVLYLRTSDSTNPNSKFISMSFENFYSNVGVSLSYDLATGEDVYWLPLIKGTSTFGNELDNEEQLGFSIEGSGNITFINDRSYWDDRFEKWVWDSQDCFIYSWSRDLSPSEAKPIYRGKIVGKSESSSTVSFKLKDQLAGLREFYPLSNIEDLSTEIVPNQLLTAKQRQIYGKVFGNLPTNIDQEVDGYELTGTISVTAGSATVTGAGTSFLSDISPDDQIILTINGEIEEFTVKSVTSNTVLDLTEELDVNLSGQDLIIRPALPKKYINRVWLLAGHECSQPERTVTDVFNIRRFTLDDVSDIHEGDQVYIGPHGSGEFARVQKIQGNEIILNQNLLNPPAIGGLVTRPCVQELRWNTRELIFSRDYDITFTGGKTFIELSEEFEKNLRPVRQVNGSVTITSGLRSVTGTGTQFTKQLEPNGWIRGAGNIDFFEILSIESDTALTLRTAASYSDTGDAQYLGGQNFNPEVDFLSCTVYGATANGDHDGEWLSTASELVEDILSKVDITNINTASFSKSHTVAPYTLGLVIPETYSQQSVPTVRDLINKINFSVFGSLIQNKDLELEYNILRPNKPPDALVLRERDILNLSSEVNSERVSKKAIVEYKPQEHEYLTKLHGASIIEKSSDNGLYLVESKQDREIKTLLVDDDDARILANRWAFLLELGTTVLKISTKLQAVRLQVNDIVKIEHEKLFERVGGGKVKYAAVQAIRKSSFGVELELDDLSNMFNRVAIIAETGSPDFDNSSLDEKSKHGFITDSYGLINNDENTFFQNLIW